MADQKKEEQKRAPKKLYLRVALDHPNKRYRIQKHLITDKVQEFELSHEEQLELEGKAGKRWVVVCTKEDAAAQKKRDKAWTKAMKSDEV